MFALTTLPTPLYRDYARHFHFSVITLTLVYAAYVAGTLSTLFFLGRTSDQLGRRRVSLTAMSLAALSLLVFIFAIDTAMLFVARVLTGVAAGLSSGTATAWLRDLQGSADEKAASTRIVAINIFGLGLGPLLCGVLASFAPDPRQTPFAVLLLLFIPALFAISWTRDTVRHRRDPLDVSLKPRVGVPSDLHRPFLAPAVTTFVIFSLVGFYSAIAPSLLSDSLRVHGHAMGGAIISELFMMGVLAVYATAVLSARSAMLAGAAMMLPALLLLALAQILPSLPALVMGTGFGGISLGLGYRGSLQVSNAIAPKERRAELISALFVCGNLGLALPVIGVGITSALISPAIANLAFAGVITLLAIAGLVFGATTKPPAV